MKIRFVCFIILLLLSNVSSAQIEAKTWDSKKCFYSIEEAQKAIIDSVECLILVGYPFKDFPKEVLKFKKLRHLYIGASLRPKHKKDESIQMSKLIDSLFKVGELGPYKYTEFYNYPVIKSIPKEISELSYLQDLFMYHIKIKNKKKFKKIYKYLPNTIITPSIYELDDYINGTPYGE